MPLRRAEFFSREFYAGVEEKLAARLQSRVDLLRDSATMARDKARAALHLGAKQVMHENQCRTIAPRAQRLVEQSQPFFAHHPHDGVP
jgi:hypothetical protein